MSVKVTTAATMKADLKIPIKELEDKLGLTEEEKQIELFSEEEIGSDSNIEDAFVMDLDNLNTEEDIETEEDLATDPLVNETGEVERNIPIVRDASGKAINVEDRKEKEAQYIESIVSKIQKLKQYKDSEKYDPKVLPNYLVTAVNNMRQRGINSAKIFEGLGLTMMGRNRFRQEDWKKYQDTNAERKQQGLNPLTINEFKEAYPNILQERGDNGFINVDNEGNVLEPNVPITRGSHVNLTAQAAMYHTQLLDAAVVDEKGNISVDPSMPYIMSLAMEQFLVDEMFAAQKDADAEGITPTQLLDQRLNGVADKSLLFDDNTKNIILEEAKGMAQDGKLPTVKKTEMNEKLGRGFYLEWKRFQADQKKLNQDFYVADYESLSSDVFVVLGDMISKLYSRANAHLFKELPEKVNKQSVFQITPEGIIQFSRLRQGLPGIFAQPEIEPDRMSSPQTGQKVTEQAVLTRDTTGKVGSLEDLPGTEKGKERIDKAVINKNKVQIVNDPRREKLAIWSTLLAFNGHDIPLIGGEQDVASTFMTKEFGIGQHKLEELYQEKDLLKMKAEMAANAGLMDKAERLYEQHEAYDPISILRETQEKFLNVSNAVQKYSKRSNHLTYAVQALTGRIHAQQTLYNPQAHKLIRFVAGSGKVYQFKPNGKSEVEKGWKEIMSAFLYEARFKKENRTARLSKERIQIFDNEVDGAKYKQYVSWGNHLLNNLENFDTNGGKQQLKLLHAYARASSTPNTREVEKNIKATIKQNFNNNFLASQPELMQWLSGHEEEVILYMDYLMDLAKWDQAKKAGGIHKSSIITEIDGKTHGPATMAMALGSVAIAKRAGVLIPDTTLAGELLDFKDLRFAMADSMLARFNLLLDHIQIPIDQQPAYKTILQHAITDTANFLKKSPMTYGYGQELESLKEYVAITVKSSPVAKEIGAKVIEAKLKQEKVIEFLHGMLVDSIYQTFDPETIQINQVLKSNAQLAILTDQPIKFVNSAGFTSWISGKESSLDERKVAHYTFAEPFINAEGQLMPGQKKAQQSVQLHRNQIMPASMTEVDGKVQVGRETAGGLLATITQSKDGNMVARVFTDSWKSISEASQKLEPAITKEQAQLMKAKGQKRNEHPFILPIFDAFVVDLGSFNAVRSAANEHHYNSLIESRDTEQVLEWGNQQIEKLSTKEADDSTPVEIFEATVGPDAFYNGWQNLGIEHRGLRHLFPGAGGRFNVDKTPSINGASKALTTLVKRILDVAPQDIVGKNKIMTVDKFSEAKHFAAMKMASQIERAINSDLGFNLAPDNRAGLTPTTSLTKGDIKKIIKIIIGPKGLNLKQRNDNALVDLKKRRAIIIEELRKQGVSMNVDLAN